MEEGARVSAIETAVTSRRWVRAGDILFAIWVLDADVWLLELKQSIRRILCPLSGGSVGLLVFTHGEVLMTPRLERMLEVVGARDLRLSFLLAALCSGTTALPAVAQAPAGAHASASPAKMAVKWADIPLSFEPNMGQETPGVRYFARGRTYTLYLADAEMLLNGRNEAPLKMTFVGANPAPRIVGEGRQVSTSNYLIGNDPSKWRTSVPNYGRTRYASVYPGIDLVLYGHDGGDVEYDWVVSPAADPRQIRLRFESAARLRVDSQGDLVIDLGGTEYRQKQPVAYQDVGGTRIEIAATWRLHGKEAGFRIGRYDRQQPLIIDPAIYYSTYLGGGNNDYAYAVAVDEIGNTYVTGGTASTNFPTANALQGSLRGSNDVFVTKINAAGTARIYSTFLGSGGVDEGRGIAVNSLGEVYVTGSAGFSDFPLKNAIQSTWGASGDAFLTKLDSTGASLVYSTYLGGNAVDYGTAIALDSAGSACITGVTFSTNFPTVAAFQAAKGAQQDAFVAKINPSGSAWLYVTYLGGNSVDEAYGIALDTPGNAYVAGWTQSTNFPLQSAFQGSNHGGVDGFVTKLNPAGSALVYSTYLGGTGNDNATAIAVDGSGSAFVTGVAASEDFPVANAIDITLGSHAVDDVFIARFNPAGSALMYSTFVGGASGDDGYAIAIDQAGNAYVTGRTNSSDYPLVNPVQGSRVAFDMFVTEINASGSALLFSTFVGGSGSESGRGIAIDSSGNIHIAGESTSTDFPVAKAVQTVNGGNQDAVVLLFATTVPMVTVSLDRQSLTFSVTNSGSAFISQTGPQLVRLTQTGTPAVSWTATSDKPWLVVTPTSGRGSATLTVSTQFVPGLIATQTGTITIANAANSVGPIAVTLNSVASGTSQPPFGTFDTPANGATGISGSIPVTGWALDDVQVTRVTVCRDPLTGESGANPANCGGAANIYIGDGVFVDGARPDVQAAYPAAPMNSRAGWGYLMLTNFLPNLGNGTFTLRAYAFDADGHTALLGAKTITCDNAHSVNPFGAIDTPGQGEVISGSYASFGWVLSPGAAKADGADGGTVTAFVDGTSIGTPAGWTARSDLTALFPVAQYSGVDKALGVIGIDSMSFANGLHTYAWIVTDTAAHSAGVGSRFIGISNGSLMLDPNALQPSNVITASNVLEAPHGAALRIGASRSALLAEADRATPDLTTIQGRRGFDLERALQAYPAVGDRIDVQAEELDRVELHLSATSVNQYTGYLRAAGRLAPLPIGSHLDTSTGEFTWMPGVGFYGVYDFVFVRWTNGVAAARQDVRITLNAKGSNRVGPQTIIDAPSAGTQVRSAFSVGGWAADLDSAVDTGVSAVHVWAYPIDASGKHGDPTFIGPAIYGGSRRDVAAVYGDRFADSAYGISVDVLPPGTYDIAVFAYSTVVNNFTPAKVVRITVIR